MIDVVDIQFYPSNPSPIQHDIESAGFEVSASGMTITLGSGTIRGKCSSGVVQEYSFDESSFLAEPPASGTVCVGAFIDTFGTVTFLNDSSSDPDVGPGNSVISKVAWVYVDAGDTDLSGKTFFRNV